MKKNKNYIVKNTWFNPDEHGAYRDSYSIEAVKKEDLKEAIGVNEFVFETLEDAISSVDASLQEIKFMGLTKTEEKFVAQKINSLQNKKPMSELFWNCHCGVAYQTAGLDVNYAFVSEGDMLYIYFQGSSSTTDWIRNFLFKKKPYKDMGIPYRVHRGFLNAWKEVEDIIIAKITEKNELGAHKWKSVVVVGYSHGGALAAFCHECVWYHRPDLRNYGLVGYGFEAPRIFGGWHVPKALRERWEHFTVTRNCKDIVTYCPPVIFRYCHVGSLLKVGTKSAGLIKDHYPEPVHAALIDYETTNTKEEENK